ncbi:type I-C CRISPR-associated protein Cas8c/Csd1 [Endothiovibrio diazotrophicus]
MILQALNDYYQRKAEEPDSGIAPYGFERKGIEFVVVIDRDGALVDLAPNRETQGKKAVARQHLVPQGVKKTSGVAANLLWDNIEYVLGVVTKGKPERTRQAHEAFVGRIRDELGELGDQGVDAVLVFLDRLDLSELEHHEQWEAVKATTGNLTFRLQGETELVCQRPAVRAAFLERLTAAEGGERRLCAVTGTLDTPQRLHPAIKGVWGAQSSGANIVSFNLDAFSSYGKQQGLNAPVGERGAFAYTTALNHLLRRESRQRLQVGDASTVFWSSAPSILEETFPDLLGEPDKEDPEAYTEQVRDLFRAVERGGYTADDSTNRFHVLGLAPNAARIAVRFWHTGTVAEIGRRIADHFRDLEIVHGPRDRPYPSLFRLLAHTAVQGKADNIPPNLGGELMRAVIGGGPYPYTLLQAAVARNRAERNVDYYRAALIKAVLRRRPTQSNEKEINVALDPENPNVGYRLGRLFAVLERIQQLAQGDINATIRDKFYGAASANPLSVFANLLKLKNHHLAKLNDKGRVTWAETLIGQILGGVTEFPAQLALPDQGQFAIGYYQQRQDFFRPKEPGPDPAVVENLVKRLGANGKKSDKGNEK